MCVLYLIFVACIHFLINPSLTCNLRGCFGARFCSSLALPFLSTLSPFIHCRLLVAYGVNVDTFEAMRVEQGRVASCEKRCRVAKSGLQVALQCRLSTLAFRVCTSAASVVMAWRMGSKRPGAKGKSLRGQVHPLANQDPQHSPQ